MSETSSPTKSTKSTKSDKSTTKSSSDSTAKSTSTTDTPAKGKSAKEQAAAGHSISYFSSISTDEYRAGWDSIFGKKSNGKDKEPTTITLDPADFDENLRAALRQALAKRAATLGLDIDSLEASSTVDWQLACTYIPR